MKPSATLRCFLLPALAGAVLLVPCGALAAEILPLSEVWPGMTGKGRTVFEGTRIDEFDVQVIGVLENAVGPRQSLILARLTGGPLANTGVIAGMSGSPVYVDGKLMGAVSYGFPFSKETIAGITPIQEMIEATSTQTPRAASARMAPPLGAAGPRLPLDRDAFVAALRRPLQVLYPDTTRLQSGAVPGGLPASGLSPLPLPMTLAGFAPATFEWARGLFSGLGFAPFAGLARSGMKEPLPSLAPGGPVGVSLVEGDLDISVTGTITHIEGDRVYAFGHPFYNLGPTQFPMKKAYVYSVFPSLYQSWKIAAAGEPVGIIEQDRTTAIAGRVGPTPRLIPVTVSLDTSRGQKRSFSFRIVEDELFSPVLAFVSLLSVLQSNERAFGTSTISLHARLLLGGGREVRVEDLFTDEQPAIQAAALVAAPVAYLMSNDFQPVSVDRIEVEASSHETIQSASLQRVWLERSDRVRPGSSVPLRIQLRTYRGETLTETIPVVVPASAPAGNYTVLVADAAALTAIEQREMRQQFMPRDLDQLIRAINGLRRNNQIYARLLRADEGAIVSGEYLQSLPPSVLSVLGRSDESGGVIPIRTAAVWDFALPTDYAVTGSRTLTLTVER
jgi:hypothetical protein